MIKERKIGEVFFDHGQKYQCVKGFYCKYCTFCVIPEGEGMVCTGDVRVTGHCSGLFRLDNEFVIFKSV